MTKNWEEIKILNKSKPSINEIGVKKVLDEFDKRRKWKQEYEENFFRTDTNKDEENNFED